MAVPSFLNGTYRYFTRPAVLDVQTIIDDLYAELVTGLGWTCTLGGIGVTPTTYQTPVGSQGEFFTINLARAGVTPITTLQIICTDSYGLVINNQTHTHLFIDAGGTDIFIYSGNGMPYVCIDSERAVPETFFCAQLDRYPDGAYQSMWLCSGGPRTAAEALTYDEPTYAFWRSHLSGDTAYPTTPSTYWYNQFAPSGGSYVNKTVSGAILFRPCELQDDDIYYGKIPQALWLDSGVAFKAEVVVPIDTGVTGTFKVSGGALSDARKMCWRKA